MNLKKKLLVTFFILTIFTIFIHNVNSQEDTTSIDSLKENLDKVNQIKENLTDKEIRSDYLKGEWTKVFEKSQSGRFFLEVSKIFQVLSPIFKLFLGVEYSLSWLFFLSLLFGILIFNSVYKTTTNVFGLDTFISLIISFVMLGFAGLTGAIKNTVLFFEPLFTNGISIFVTAAAITTIIFLSSKFLKKLGKYLKEKKKQAKENMREQREEIKDKVAKIKFKAGDYD